MNTKRRANCQLWHDWKERIIRIGDEQTSLQNQFDNLRNEFTDNSPRIAALEADVNALDGRVIIAESDIAEVEDRVTACENDIDRIDAELVDKTGEINNLANRMSLAEADIDDIDARLEGIEAGEILLSQLVPDADKDMAGKTLSNVGIDANSLTVNGSKIEPTRIDRQFTLIDWQPLINAEKLKKTPAVTISYNDNTDIDMPFAKFVTVDSCTAVFSQINTDVRPYIGDTDGIYFTCYYKSGTSTRNTLVAYVRYYDYNNQHIDSRYVNLPIILDNKWHKVTAKIAKTPNAVYCSSLIEVHPENTGLSFSGCRVHTNVSLDVDLTAKIISADGVVIKDGGTVDGVDVSTHNHDGTAIGGPKISYNNLVDKPQVDVSTHTHDGTAVGGTRISYNNLVDKPDVAMSTHNHDGTAIGGPKISYNDLVDKPDIPTSLPKPPMPYKKTVSIDLASPGDSIHVLDIIPEGRTALTVEQLQYREIANINEGSGQFVDIGIRYDDNTIYSGIDRITKNGDTPWHPPTYPSFNPVYHFTKNYIIGIRITRTHHEGPNITGYVDIFGHVY